MKCFLRTAKMPNQLMLFINFSLPQKSVRIKFYNNRRKKIHFSNVLSTTQLKDRFDSVFSMMPLFNLLVTTAKHPLKPKCTFKEKMTDITGESLNNGMLLLVRHIKVDFKSN